MHSLFNVFVEPRDGFGMKPTEECVREYALSGSVFRDRAWIEVLPECSPSGAPH